jgi:ferredoxin
MRISVDQSKCVSSGQCVLRAPEVFDQQDEDGVVFLLDNAPPDSLLPKVRLAEQVCPAFVIRVVE